MNIIRHIPNFVDCDRDFTPVEFNSLEELLEIEWIKQWVKKDFVRFSQSGRELMVELKNSFYVLGTFGKRYKIGLPEFIDKRPPPPTEPEWEPVKRLSPQEKNDEINIWLQERKKMMEEYE